MIDIEVTWERDPFELNLRDGTRLVSYSGWEKVRDPRHYGEEIVIDFGHIRLLGPLYIIEPKPPSRLCALLSHFSA